MNTRPLKVCITGGAGFIGSKLAARWQTSGAEVTAIDDLSTGRKENLPPGVTLVQADILDTHRVSEAIRGAELLYHLAARVAIRSSFEFVVSDMMVNVAGTASVLRAAQLVGTVKKFVFTSSMAVYSDSVPGSLISESSPTVPISPYGISKLAAEALTFQLCSQASIDAVVLRLFNTYGPGQKLSPYVGVVTIFCNRLTSGQAPVIFGDGQQCRDFVHVNDVVRAAALAGQQPVPGEVFNVGAGIPVTVNQVADELQSALDIRIAPKHVPSVPGELRSSVADISKARSMLGYVPAHSFVTSIGEVARQIVNAGVAASAMAS